MAAGDDRGLGAVIAGATAVSWCTHWRCVGRSRRLATVRNFYARNRRVQAHQRDGGPHIGRGGTVAQPDVGSPQRRCLGSWLLFCGCWNIYYPVELLLCPVPGRHPHLHEGDTFRCCLAVVRRYLRTWMLHPHACCGAALHVTGIAGRVPVEPPACHTASGTAWPMCTTASPSVHTSMGPWTPHLRPNPTRITRLLTRTPHGVFRHGACVCAPSQPPTPKPHPSPSPWEAYARAHTC